MSRVHVLQKTEKRKTREMNHFRAVTAKKKCTKKRDARAELLFFLIKPVVLLPFSLSSPSSLLIKLSNVKLFCQLLKFSLGIALALRKANFFNRNIDL